MCRRVFFYAAQKGGLKMHSWKLNGFELGLWAASAAAVLLSACFGGDLLSAGASLIGVTALIYVAKGHWAGQALTIAFAFAYGWISWKCRYYGEMITYIGMSAPMAAVAMVNWLRHPYQGSGQVTVSALSRMQKLWMWIGSAACTAAFYYILQALGTANLAVSTVSVTTSFLAAYLTACRSPYYALAYAANDIVLIVLWIAAARTQPDCIPMIACFAAFLANDIYGFYAWQRMKRRQRGV